MISSESIRKRLNAGRVPNIRGDVITEQSMLSTCPIKESKDHGYGGISFNSELGGAGLRIQCIPAAVLIALIDYEDGFCVLLTRRRSDMNNHAGQVAFPGGRVDAADKTPIHTALREAQEEVNIGPESVDVLGNLDPYLTTTGFEVIPVVSIIPPQDFIPEPLEVDEIFEVPLSFLLNKDNHQKVCRKINGQDRAYYAIPYKTHYIWGATAGMIVNLYEVLRDK